MSDIILEIPLQIVHKFIKNNTEETNFIIHTMSYQTLECGKCNKQFKANTSLIGATCPECKTRGIIK